MARFQFEKKQVLPAIGMAVASVGLFGYFVWKMTTPPPLQAAPNSSPQAQTASARGSAASPNVTAGTAGTPSDPLAALDPNIGPPTDAMRDPFTPAIVDPGTLAHAPGSYKVATSNIGQSNLSSVPGMPGGLPPMRSVGPMPLPGVGGLSPAPGLGSAPAGASWIVTGVISENAEPQNRVAVLRSGDARRFVKLGDMVDGTYRLVDVNRTGVVIADGDRRIRLPLGGSTKPTAHTPVANGAATGPWTGMPASGSSQPGAAQPGQPNLLAPNGTTAPGQGPPIPAQSAPSVPVPAQAAPSGGLY